MFLSIYLGVGVSITIDKILMGVTPKQILQDLLGKENDTS